MTPFQKQHIRLSLINLLLPLNELSMMLLLSLRNSRGWMLDDEGSWDSFRCSRLLTRINFEKSKLLFYECAIRWWNTLAILARQVFSMWRVSTLQVATTQPQKQNNCSTMSNQYIGSILFSIFRDNRLDIERNFCFKIIARSMNINMELLSSFEATTRRRFYRVRPNL